VSFDPDAYRSRELATVGAIIDVSVQGRALNIEPVPARGLIDTGASVVFLDRRLALQAGLKAVDI
jgi:predicted aspartyl protease